MWAVAVAAVAWFGLVVLSPVLPAPLAAAVYAAGGFICHQLPERSFHWHGAQLAVCARCTGIYLGACSAAILAALPRPIVARSGPESRLGGLLAAAAAPTIVTVAAEWSGAWVPTAVVRACTGVLLGVAAAIMVSTALNASPGERLD